jgi:bacterioferritin-associated ferredoxin
MMVGGAVFRQLLGERAPRMLRSGCTSPPVRGTLRVVALICLCEGVSERKVRRAIEQGAGTLAEIGERCGAGTSCLSCHPTLEDALHECRVALPGRRLAF